MLVRRSSADKGAGLWLSFESAELLPSGDRLGRMLW